MSRLVLGIGVAAILVSAVGCGGGAAPGASGEKIVIVSNTWSPFWDAARKGALDAAKDLGVEVDVIQNDGTAARQISHLERLAARSDVKGIAVSVVDTKASGIGDQMRRLRQKGVHVVAVDSDGPKDARAAFIGTNNLEAGRELGRAAKQLRPDGGKAVCFVGISTAQNAIERIGGFEEGAAPAITRVTTMEDNVDLNRARNNVVNAIQNHPDVRVLVGIWSPNAPAIVSTLEGNGRRKEFTVVTFDAEQDAIRAMRQGMIDCMVVQNPYEMGYQSVRLLKASIRKDDATIQEMLKGTDIYDTGLKVVVPDEQSPVQSEHRRTLKELDEFMKSKGIQSS